MTRLPILRAREILAALQKVGYYIDHTTGSHYILRHPQRPGRVVVPYHGNRDIKRAVLASVLRQAGLSEEEFCEFL